MLLHLNASRGLEASGTVGHSHLADYRGSDLSTLGTVLAVLAAVEVVDETVDRDIGRGLVAAGCEIRSRPAVANIGYNRLAAVHTGCVALAAGSVGRSVDAAPGCRTEIVVRTAGIDRVHSLTDLVVGTRRFEARSHQQVLQGSPAPVVGAADAGCEQAACYNLRSADHSLRQMEYDSVHLILAVGRMLAELDPDMRHPRMSFGNSRMGSAHCCEACRHPGSYWPLTLEILRFLRWNVLTGRDGQIVRRES